MLSFRKKVLKHDTKVELEFLTFIYFALGIIQKQNKITIESGSYDNVDEHDMNVKIIIYNYKQDELESKL